MTGGMHRPIDCCFLQSVRRSMRNRHRQKCLCRISFLARPAPVPVATRPSRCARPHRRRHCHAPETIEPIRRPPRVLGGRAPLSVPALFFPPKNQFFVPRRPIGHGGGAGWRALGHHARAVPSVARRGWLTEGDPRDGQRHADEGRTAIRSGQPERAAPAGG